MSLLTKTQLLKSILNKTGLEKKQIFLIVLYGSNLDLNYPDKDIDLFIVVNNQIDYQTIEIDNYDLIFVNQDYFHIALGNFEPLIIEPLLTGKIIWGHQEDYQQIISRQTITNANLIHLCYLALKLYYWAELNYQNQAYQDCLQNLSYALSYFLMAQSLKHQNKILCFQQMLKNQLLAKTTSLLKQKQKNPQNIREILDLSTKYLTDFL